MSDGDRELSPRVRVLAGIAIAVYLVAIAAANLPSSRTKERIAKVENPVLTAIGARQFWSVFAPDPSRIVIDTEVRFQYADGTTGRWRIARGNPLVGSYSDYRWLKLGENAELPAAGPSLLGWAVRERAGGKRVVRAALIRRVRPIAPPGRPASAHPPLRTDVLVVGEFGGGR